MVNINRVRDTIHYALHAVFVPLAVWFWNERRILKEVIEDKLERRHTHMDSNKLQQKLKVVYDLIDNAPALIADTEAAYANEKDPVGEANAIRQLLIDLKPALTDLKAEIETSVVPPAPATPPAPAA